MIEVHFDHEGVSKTILSTSFAPDKFDPSLHEARYTYFRDLVPDAGQRIARSIVNPDRTLTLHDLETVTPTHFRKLELNEQTKTYINWEWVNEMTAAWYVYGYTEDPMSLPCALHSNKKVPNEAEAQDYLRQTPKVVFSGYQEGSYGICMMPADQGRAVVAYGRLKLPLFRAPEYWSYFELIDCFHNMNDTSWGARWLD